jgi:hypothetical protein
MMFVIKLEKFSVRIFSLFEETIPLYVIKTTAKTIEFVGIDTTIKLVNVCPTIRRLANIQLQNL